MNHKSSVARSFVRLLAMPMAIMLAGQSTAKAESGPIELKWSELSSHIQGHDIEIVLPDATSLTGEVETVREDALVLNVKKTSNSKAHPKGNAVIPRASVSGLSLKESRGKWGRSIGVTLGTLTGVSLGGYVAAANARSAAAGLSTFLAISGAGTLTGYLVGRSADRREKSIRVVP